MDQDLIVEEVKEEKPQEEKQDYINPPEKKVVIKTEEGYQKVLQRLEAGDRMIAREGGFDSAPKTMVDLYDELAQAALDYQIEHDLLDLK